MDNIPPNTHIYIPKDRHHPVLYILFSIIAFMLGAIAATIEYDNDGDEDTSGNVVVNLIEPTSTPGPTKTPSATPVTPTRTPTIAPTRDPSWMWCTEATPSAVCEVPPNPTATWTPVPSCPTALAVPIDKRTPGAFCVWP